MNIQREVEALRDIRRRSTTPGALAIDPDLPAHSSSGSNGGYWSGDHDSSSSNEDGSSSNDHASDSGSGPASDDPFHLFWVPASVHPEIAPAEFRAFLKEHSRSPPPGDGPVPTRSSSLSSAASSGLGRKRSMLSRQYSPSEHDGVEDKEEKIVPLRRNRTGRFSNQGPQLTISDLQKLEELAEEASQSNDPTKFRNILRRSLSLNVSPTAMDKLDAMPEMGDEADTPIIVPPPGQILRRAARTKIRKPSLPGDGGGHRFGASRRGTSARAATKPAERTSSDRSSSDHGHIEYTESSTPRPRALSDDFHSTRPESFSEVTSIFDAYARDDNDEFHSSIVVTTSPPPPEPEPLPEVSAPAHLPPHEVQPSLLEALGTVLEQTPPQQPSPSAPQPTPQPSLPQEPPSQSQPQIHQPQPERLLTPQLGPDPPSPSRTPSPSSAEGGQGTSPTPSFLSSPPSPQPSQPHRKEKDKKGLFGKWGSDKGGKKHSKDKDHTRGDSGEKDKEKEKESGFFGSLFGGKKNKDSDAPPPIAVQSGAAGREAAQALLGTSKSSKNYQPPPSPGAAAINNYSRYPIHVERAIYRLSHIKLANPRRPLYEQVLISNLMFWYLGVINKAQNPTPPNGQAGIGAGGGPAGQANGAGAQDKEAGEKEQREAEQREKERLEREAHEKEQREREMENKKRDVSPKRGSLTKAGAGGGARRAEMPVKGPQYEMQHREMQQEYGYGSGQGTPRGRGPSTPGAGAGGTPSQRMSPPNSIPPRLVQQSSENQTPDNFYYSPDTAQQRLPPGAMAPADQSTWGGKPQRNSPPPGPHRRSTSPPQQGGYNSSQNDYVVVGSDKRSPGRSLSATASPSPPLANGKVRKGTSAHAVAPKGRPRTPEGANGMGDEDVPLAVWQQQRRR
ncbi:hypothetical protein VKT23_005132 [Stygiomarasmius scandens]|uniref:Protein Zds1 C-terminal domain-containing protein n=1 Tax=Marasmiellus scandens TaxID=2682957 RepID=A0ABR1JY41_9AGAR